MPRLLWCKYIPTMFWYNCIPDWCRYLFILKCNICKTSLIAKIIIHISGTKGTGGSTLSLLGYRRPLINSQ